MDQAVADLAEYTGGAVVDSIERAKAQTVVLVGKQIVRNTARSHKALLGIGLDGLSEQGFLLRTVPGEGIDFVVAAGGGSRGDAYAVIELIKAVEKNGEQALLGQTEIREEPFFIRRGMYAHQHWAYAYPYALRSWSFEDWRSYVDLLAYLKINFFSIWSMVGILPNPLSDADRQYLQNYRAVIDYARDRRGMEVFIGECANNVAESDAGVPVQERGYFDVEVLKDPSDPKQFQDIMDSRRNLYTIADNADGYWIIDSDPGGFEGSPVSEFVDILIGNRKLIDECTEKGKNAKLAYWMWVGWAKGKPKTDQGSTCRAIVENMRDRLKEPWILFPCWGNHLDACRDLGYMDKSIFFPYGTVEDEPSPPTTRLRFDEMFFHLNNCISVWDGRNAMANAQSPVVQLPNIFFFAQTAWHGVPPAEPAARDVVTPLAKLLAPDIADDLAEGWLMLKERDAGKVLACAARLDKIARQEGAGRVGALGHHYSPGLTRLLSDLATQLRVHAGARVVCEALARFAPLHDVMPALSDYYSAALDWHRVHDFRRCHCYGPDVTEMAGLWQAYRDKVPLPDNYMSDLGRELVGKGYDQWFVEGYIALTGPK